MDEEMAKLILEFLLRQDIEDRVLNNILSALPLVTKDFRLKKALLIRRIGSAVSNGSVDEKILEILETVEELDYGEGNPSSAEVMKAAYCAVAVDCTARFLEVEEENNGKYLVTAKRVWKEKITKMEKSERKVDLLSEELLSWREEIMSAIWEPDVRNKILSMDTRSEACKTVKKYLAEAWRELGPSYLELVAENVVHKRGEIDMEMTGNQKSGENVDMNGQVAGERIDDEQNLEVEESELGMEETQKMVRRKVPRSIEAKIVDAASPKRRRVKKVWSPLEEDTLRVGVKKFSKGNWKIILHAYHGIFEGRNEVDLKDKWRNLTR